jgi:hypothetical protein
MRKRPMTPFATTRTFRDVRYPVAIGGKADDICSLRDFPLMTDAVEKGFVSIVVSLDPAF